ncbi:MAG: hypothetical protein HN754_12270 [Opitutae bacterium]|nr:hypothetical protein [Opitutae bacterium]
MRNLSSKTIFLEWIDFEGTPRQRRTLRPKDHHEINSFVSHAWQIIDRDTNKRILDFILPKNKTSQFTFLNSHYQ